LARQLQAIKLNNESFIWEWGINGYFSVMSTALAGLIAASYGFL